MIGTAQRKGNVAARVTENIRTETLEGFVREGVSTDVSLLNTDEHCGYRNLSPNVVGAIHTNTIEGFWNISKRGIMGTFHKVGHKYLPLYIAEFEFRYNNRTNPDIFGTAIGAC